MSLDVTLTTIKCPTCGHQEEVWSGNITHNLGAMADKAGLYKCVWRPEDFGIITAQQMIEPLSAGIKEMEGNPTYYKQFNAPNGWGLYEHFLPWLKDYLCACEKYPTAIISVIR